jgi:sugar transferase (PEP-CTERM/EpsH1 system associated)
MRILVISDCVPYPLISGGKIRLYNLLLRIARQHEVWLATFLDSKEEMEGLLRIQEICHRVEIVQLNHKRKLAYLPDLLKFGLTGKPVELVYYNSSELVRRIQTLISLVDFDIVQIEHSHMALYLEALPSNLWPKSILTFQNVEFVRLDRFFQIERKPVKKIRRWLSSRMMRVWEPHYAEHFGRCIAMSEFDQHLLEAANPRLRINVVTNGIDTHSFHPLPLSANQKNLIFVGSMNYGPCIDAMLFFCNEVLPRIRAMMGKVELWIVGSNPSPEVIKLDGNGVHVTGRVSDVVPYYNQIAVCVVPLRAGGGTRLKILEAMGLGRPVVSTTIGCEGLDVVDGKHLLVGDSPEQFAQQTARLLKDPELYDRIVANGRQLVVTRYDWDVIAEELMVVYRELGN